MIPHGTFITPPITAAFKPPGDQAYLPLYQIATGALELGDGNGGREQQLWEVAYVGGEARIAKVGEAYELAIPLVGVLTISLAFDANMGEVLAYATASGCSLRFFNSVTSLYETLEIAGASSCRVVVDDPREFAEAASDVIFGYVKSGSLYYRQQRDRYEVEYLIGEASGDLIAMGMNLLNRLQFEVL